MNKKSPKQPKVLLYINALLRGLKKEYISSYNKLGYLKMNFILGILSFSRLTIILIYMLIITLL